MGPLRSHFRVTLESLWSHFVHMRLAFTSLWDISESPWGHCGTLWDHLGSLLDHLRLLWVTFVPLWCHIAATLEHFGVIWGYFGAHFGGTLAYLGSLWCGFGYVRVTWGSLWPNFEKHSVFRLISMILCIDRVILE